MQVYFERKPTMSRTYPDLKHGDRVRVTGRGPGDHGEAGRVGTFVEYTPRGFARVRLDPKPGWKNREPDIWLIHPESLEPLYSPDHPEVSQ